MNHHEFKGKPIPHDGLEVWASDDRQTWFRAILIAVLEEYERCPYITKPVPECDDETCFEYCEPASEKPPISTKLLDPIEICGAWIHYRSDDIDPSMRMVIGCCGDRVRVDMRWSTVIELEADQNVLGYSHTVGGKVHSSFWVENDHDDASYQTATEAYEAYKKEKG